MLVPSNKVIAAACTGIFAGFLIAGAVHLIAY
jgi:hypothetical protein